MELSVNIYVSESKVLSLCYGCPKLFLSFYAKSGFVKPGLRLYNNAFNP